MKPMHFLFVLTVLALLGLSNGCSPDVTNPVATQETRVLLASEATVSDWQVINHWGTDSIPALSVVSVGDASQDKLVTLFSPQRFDLTQYDEIVISFEVAIRASERVNTGARFGYSLGESDREHPNNVDPFLPSTAVGSFGGGEIRFICSEARVSTVGRNNVFLAVDFGINRVEGAGPDTSSVSIETFEIYGVHR